MSEDREEPITVTDKRRIDPQTGQVRDANIEHRQIFDAFKTAILDYSYQGRYVCVYPIKVNQQRHVVEEIVEFGKATGVGLECGSKPELQAVLALSESTDHLIICNGYKDEEFMRLALMGQRLGHEVYIVIEQVSELDVLLKVAGEMGVTPQAGVRIKLSTEGSGRWAQSGGEKSKFGLSPAQLMQVIERLQAAGQLDIIKLIHCHLGSQITDIRYIKAGLQELSRFYVELRALGIPVTHVDVGGGYLTLTHPWPGMTRGIYGDPDRFSETYWSRFPGRYFAGDGAKRDSDGDLWLLDAERDTMTRLTTNGGTGDVVWSPDDSQIRARFENSSHAAMALLASSARILSAP